MTSKPTYEELEQKVKELEKSEAKHKRTEAALLESEERYRNLFNNNHSVMLLIDPKSADIIDANPAAISYYGWSHEELICKKITNINTLTAEQVFQEMEKAKSEERRHFIFRHRQANGDVRDVEVCSGPITLHGKQLLYSIVHDITERKRAEEALQESEERFRELADLLPVSIYEMDDSGKLTYANRGAFDQFGYTQGDLNQGVSGFDMIAPEDRKKSMQNIQRIVSGEQLGLQEYIALRKDGSTFPVLINSAPITHEGKNVGLRGFIIDVTDLKKTEEALRESEEKYRNLVERANDGVIMVQNGKVQFANPVLAKIFGFTVEKMINTSFLDYVFPDERPRIADLHKQRLQFEDVPEMYEMMGLHKNGRRIDLEINAALITYQGEPVTLSFVRDITDRKKTEIDRRQKETLQGIVELAGAICHELNQPLQAISGISDLLMMDVDDDSPIYENVQAIKMRVYRMAEITRKLMSITQYKTKDYLKSKILDIDKASEQVKKK
ncbi:PAS domain S-box protein [Thermodesulfobacteriota bacterium]